MRKELKVGGLTHGGGRPEIGPFHGGPTPAGMTKISLDEAPRHIAVRDVKEFRAGKLRATGRYELEWYGATLTFQSDAEVREWMVKHRYRRTGRSRRVAGKWTSAYFSRKRPQ